MSSHCESLMVAEAWLMLSLFAISAAAGWIAHWLWHGPLRRND